jgi:NH3-dependent NAD+ synthetase
MNVSFKELLPDIKDKNVIVFLSGGVESTLLAKLCLETYGNDRTILVSFLIQDSGVGSISSNEDQILKNIVSNIENAEKLLCKKAIKFEITKGLNKPRDHFDKMFLGLLKSFNAECAVMGRLRTEFEIIEILKNSPSHSQNLKHLIDYCHNTLPTHLQIFKEHHMALTTLVPELTKIFQHTTIQTYNIWNDKTISPFKDLYKFEVIDLYKKLDLLEMLYQTRSCIETSVLENLHCGKCFNCQQRHDAIVTAEIEDLTKYQCNDVVVNLNNHNNALTKLLIDVKSKNNSRI